MKKPLVAMVVSAVFLPSVTFCATAEKSDKTATQEAMQLLAAGRQKAAEARLVDSLQNDPKNPDLLFLDAVLARSRFEVPKAVRGLSFTMQSRPGSPEGL